MLLYLTKKRASASSRAIIIFVLIAFIVATFAVHFPKKTYASALPYMPAPTKLIDISAHINFPLLRGLQVNPKEPFKFDFIIEEGDKPIKEEEFKKESSKIIKYFLSSLTIPEEDLWVNLSPYEQDEVAPLELGKTEMGKDLLGEDYVLKQLLASLTYPESPLGKRFWKRVYQRAHIIFGTANIPINTFNKIWIVPEKAVVYEESGKAFIGEARLKVMMEEDYLALKNNLNNSEIKTDKLNENEVKDINNFSSQIMKEMVLPVIEEEINQGENFAYLRQIYYSLILALWFKKKLKESIGDSQQTASGHVLERIYVDKKKIKGVDVDDKQIKEKIYNQYLEAYKKGVYNYIKRDYDAPSQKYIQRRYYSGGMDLRELSSSVLVRKPFPLNFSELISGLSLSKAETELSPKLENQDDLGREKQKKVSSSAVTQNEERNRKLSILAETKKHTLHEETIALLDSIREILKGFNSKGSTAETKAVKEASQRTKLPQGMFKGARYDENLDVVYIIHELWEKYIGKKIGGENISGINIVPDNTGLLTVLHEKRHNKEFFLTGGIEAEISAYWGSLVDLIELVAKGNNEAFEELERISSPQGEEKKLAVRYPEDTQRRAIYLEYYRIIRQLRYSVYAKERRKSLESDSTCTNKSVTKICGIIYQLLIKDPNLYNEMLIPEQLDRFPAAAFIKNFTLFSVSDSSSSAVDNEETNQKEFLKKPGKATSENDNRGSLQKKIGFSEANNDGINSFAKLTESFQSVGVPYRQIKIIIDNLSRGTNSRELAETFIELTKSLYTTGLSPNQIGLILIKLSADKNPKSAADYYMDTGTPLVIASLVDAFDAAGLLIYQSNPIINRVLSAANHRELAQTLINNNGAFFIRSLIDFSYNPTLLLRLSLSLPGGWNDYLEVAELTEVLVLDDFIVDRYLRNPEDVEDGMFRLYSKDYQFVKLRYLLKKELFDKIKKQISKNDVDKDEIIKAICLNNYNDIISQATELVSEYAGDKGILKDFTRLESKINIIPFTKGSIESILSKLGLTIDGMEELLNYLGYKILNHKDVQMIIPIGFELLLSAYRGSAEYDHKNANYLTHALTTAITHYANKGGEALGDDETKPYGANAFHEFDLGLMMVEGRNNRQVDLAVSFAFHYKGDPLPEYACKRTLALRGKTVASLIQQTINWQVKEKTAKQNMSKMFDWIIEGRLNKEQLKILVETLKKENMVIKQKCGLKDSYYQAVFGFLDNHFFEALETAYYPYRNNKDILTRLLAEAIKNKEVILIGSRNGNQPEMTEHPWIDKGITLFDYLANEQEIRKGTFEEEDLSSVSLSMFEKNQQGNQEISTNNNAGQQKKIVPSVVKNEGMDWWQALKKIGQAAAAFIKNFTLFSVSDSSSSAAGGKQEIIDAGREEKEKASSSAVNNEGISRRKFLKTMGVATAGVVASQFKPIEALARFVMVSKGNLTSEQKTKADQWVEKVIKSMGNYDEFCDVWESLKLMFDLRTAIETMNKLVIHNEFSSWSKEIQHQIIAGSSQFTSSDVPESYMLTGYLRAHVRKMAVIPENINVFDNVYQGIARWINKVHDDYEDQDWKNKINKTLSDFNNKELFLLLSYGIFELYTGTFSLVYQEFINRVKQNGVLQWLRAENVDRQEIIFPQFLLALSSRNKIIDLVKKTGKTDETLKEICLFVHNSILNEAKKENKIGLSFLSNAVKELLDYGNEKINEYLKAMLWSIAKQDSLQAKVFSFVVMSKYKNTVFKEELKKLTLSTKERQIFNTVSYLDMPDYQGILKEGNKLVVLVDYSPSSVTYLDELKNLLTKDKRYSDRYILSPPTMAQRNRGIEYIIRGKVEGADISLEYHLAKNIKGEEFKELINSKQYSIMFTRHHSYEGKYFSGVGSDEVVPQFTGTMGVGKGAENNSLAIVLSEELAKGAQQNKDWDQLWNNMSKRLTLNNFIPPNHLSLMMSYVLQIGDEFDFSAKDNIGSLILADGGCGGVNRLPKYIPEYKNAIRAKAQSDSLFKLVAASPLSAMEISQSSSSAIGGTDRRQTIDDRRKMTDEGGKKREISIMQNIGEGLNFFFKSLISAFSQNIGSDVKVLVSGGLLTAALTIFDTASPLTILYIYGGKKAIDFSKALNFQLWNRVEKNPAMKLKPDVVSGLRKNIGFRENEISIADLIQPGLSGFPKKYLEENYSDRVYHGNYAKDRLSARTVPSFLIRIKYFFKRFFISLRFWAKIKKSDFNITNANSKDKEIIYSPLFFSDIDRQGASLKVSNKTLSDRRGLYQGGHSIGVVYNQYGDKYYKGPPGVHSLLSSFFNIPRKATMVQIEGLVFPKLIYSQRTRFLSDLLFKNPKSLNSEDLDLVEMLPQTDPVKSMIGVALVQEFFNDTDKPVSPVASDTHQPMYELAENYFVRTDGSYYIYDLPEHSYDLRWMNPEINDFYYRSDNEDYVVPWVNIENIAKTIVNIQDKQEKNKAISYLVETLFFYSYIMSIKYPDLNERLSDSLSEYENFLGFPYYIHKAISLGLNKIEKSNQGNKDIDSEAIYSVLTEFSKQFVTMHTQHKVFIRSELNAIIESLGRFGSLSKQQINYLLEYMDKIDQEEQANQEIFGNNNKIAQSTSSGIAKDEDVKKRLIAVINAYIESIRRVVEEATFKNNVNDEQNVWKEYLSQSSKKRMLELQDHISQVEVFLNEIKNEVDLKGIINVLNSHCIQPNLSQRKVIDLVGKYMPDLNKEKVFIIDENSLFRSIFVKNEDFGAVFVKLLTGKGINEGFIFINSRLAQSNIRLASFLIHETFHQKDNLLNHTPLRKFLSEGITTYLQKKQLRKIIVDDASDIGLSIKDELRNEFSTDWLLELMFNERDYLVDQETEELDQSKILNWRIDKILTYPNERRFAEELVRRFGDTFVQDMYLLGDTQLLEDLLGPRFKMIDSILEREDKKGLSWQKEYSRLALIALSDPEVSIDTLNCFDEVIDIVVDSLDDCYWGSLEYEKNGTYGFNIIVQTIYNDETIYDYAKKFEQNDYSRKEVEVDAKEYVNSIIKEKLSSSALNFIDLFGKGSLSVFRGSYEGYNHVTLFFKGENNEAIIKLLPSLDKYSEFEFAMPLEERLEFIKLAKEKLKGIITLQDAFEDVEIDKSVFPPGFDFNSIQGQMKENSVLVSLVKVDRKVSPLFYSESDSENSVEASDIPSFADLLADEIGFGINNEVFGWSQDTFDWFKRVVDDYFAKFQECCRRGVFPADYKMNNCGITDKNEVLIADIDLMLFGGKRKLGDVFIDTYGKDYQKIVENAFKKIKETDQGLFFIALENCLIDSLGEKKYFSEETLQELINKMRLYYRQQAGEVFSYENIEKIWAQNLIAEYLAKEQTIQDAIGVLGEEHSLEVIMDGSLNNTEKSIVNQKQLDNFGQMLFGNFKQNDLFKTIFKYVYDEAVLSVRGAAFLQFKPVANCKIIIESQLTVKTLDDGQKALEVKISSRATDENNNLDNNFKYLKIKEDSLEIVNMFSQRLEGVSLEKIPGQVTFNVPLQYLEINAAASSALVRNRENKPVNLADILGEGQIEYLGRGSKQLAFLWKREGKPDMVVKIFALMDGDSLARGIVEKVNIDEQLKNIKFSIERLKGITTLVEIAKDVEIERIRFPDDYFNFNDMQKNLEYDELVFPVVIIEEKVIPLVYSNIYDGITRISKGDVPNFSAILSKQAIEEIMNNDIASLGELEVFSRFKKIVDGYFRAFEYCCRKGVFPGDYKMSNCGVTEDDDVLIFDTDMMFFNGSRSVDDVLLEIYGENYKTRMKRQFMDIWADDISLFFSGMKAISMGNLGDQENDLGKRIEDLKEIMVNYYNQKFKKTFNYENINKIWAMGTESSSSAVGEDSQGTTEQIKQIVEGLKMKVHEPENFETAIDELEIVATDTQYQLSIRMEAVQALNDLFLEAKDSGDGFYVAVVLAGIVSDFPVQQVVSNSIINMFLNVLLGNQTISIDGNRKSQYHAAHGLSVIADRFPKLITQSWLKALKISLESLDYATQIEAGRVLKRIADYRSELISPSQKTNEFNIVAFESVKKEIADLFEDIEIISLTQKTPDNNLSIDAKETGEVINRILQKTGIKIKIRVHEVASIKAAKGLIKLLSLNRDSVVIVYAEEVSERLTREEFPGYSIEKFKVGDIRNSIIMFGDRIKPIFDYSNQCVIPYTFVKYRASNVFTKEEKDQAYKQLSIGKRQIIVFGSPNDNEEIESVVAAYNSLYGEKDTRNRPLLIIAPRYKQKPIFWQRLLSGYQHKIKFRNNSTLPFADMERENVLILNTKGELSKIYGISDVSIVGRDRNIVEPAIQSKPVFYFEGDWTNNQEVKDGLVEIGGAREFKLDSFREIMENFQQRLMMGKQGETFVKQFNEEKEKEVLRESSKFILSSVISAALGGEEKLVLVTSSSSLSLQEEKEFKFYVEKGIIVLIEKGQYAVLQNWTPQYTPYMAGYWSKVSGEDRALIEARDIAKEYFTPDEIMDAVSIQKTGENNEQLLNQKKAPNLRELKDEELKKIGDNLEIHGGEFLGRELTVDVLKDNGLLPKYGVEFEGVGIYFSLPYKLVNNRIAFVVYVESGGSFIARSYYRSNSQGLFRYLPKYRLIGEKVTWFDKGYSEESLNAPLFIQQALSVIIQKEFALQLKEDPYFIFSGTAHSLFDDVTGTYYRETNGKPFPLDGNFGDVYDENNNLAPEDIKFTVSEDEPDFNVLVTQFTIPTVLYGDVTVEAYLSKNGKFQYMFCKDNLNRVWIGGIEDNSEVTSLGLRKNWVYAGKLTTPAFEYAKQAGIYGNGNLSKGRYVDMYKHYISKIPVIQKYISRKQNGQTPPFYLQQGIELINENEHKKAIEVFDVAIELYPSVNSFWFHRGRAYHYLGDLVKAERDYLKAIDLDSTVLSIYLSLIDLYFQKGDIEKAEHILEDELINFDRNNYNEYRQRLDEFIVRKRFGQGVQVTLQKISIKEGNRSKIQAGKVMKGVLANGIQAGRPVILSDKGKTTPVEKIEVLNAGMLNVYTRTSLYKVSSNVASSAIKPVFLVSEELNTLDKQKNKGGIDLTPEHLDLEIKGEGINFQNVDIPFDIRNFQGFTFQIIKIKRIKNSQEIFSSPELALAN